jgi:hypothetical protein
MVYRKRYLYRCIARYVKFQVGTSNNSGSSWRLFFSVLIQVSRSNSSTFSLGRLRGVIGRVNWRKSRACYVDYLDDRFGFCLSDSIVVWCRHYVSRLELRLTQPRSAGSTTCTRCRHGATRRWWESARFHLCLRQGAGRQFAWLEAGSNKIALSHPAH